MDKEDTNGIPLRPLSLTCLVQGLCIFFSFFFVVYTSHKCDGLLSFFFFFFSLLKLVATFLPCLIEKTPPPKKNPNTHIHVAMPKGVGKQCHHEASYLKKEHLLFFPS
jgi:hypothetical protein